MNLYTSLIVDILVRNSSIDLLLPALQIYEPLRIISLLYHCLGKTQKGVEYINEKLKENKKYSQKFLETFKTLL
jgi:hypothetical protein